MIYSVFVFDSNDKSLISSRVASPIVSTPDLVLEMFGDVNKPARLNLESLEVFLYPHEDVIFMVVHDGDPAVTKLIDELKLAKPRSYRELVRIIRHYIAPRRQDVERVITIARKHVKPAVGERLKLKEQEPTLVGGFHDAYNDGYYLEARKYDPGETKTGIPETLRVFAARLTRHTAPIEEVPKKESIYRYLSRVPPEVARYYQGLIDDYDSLSTYAELSQRFFMHADELIEVFEKYKLLYTTLAAHFPGNAPYIQRAMNKVPSARRDLFTARTFAAIFSEGVLKDDALEFILEKLEEGKARSYAYYLPLAVYSSVALKSGQEGYPHELSRFLYYFDRPMYTFIKNSVLSRSLPILFDTHKGLVENTYEHIGEEILKRYLSSLAPHLIYAILASVITLIDLALENDQFLGLVVQDEILRALRTLYRYSASGSRSAAVALNRLLPTLALIGLKFEKHNKSLRETLLKSFFAISKYDYITNLVTHATDAVVDEELSEIMRKTYEL